MARPLVKLGLPQKGLDSGLMFRFCSRMSQRLPPPWTAAEVGECYKVTDANGQAIAYLYFDDPPKPDRAGGARLTRDQARRVAANITKLPELLGR